MQIVHIHIRHLSSIHCYQHHFWGEVNFLSVKNNYFTFRFSLLLKDSLRFSTWPTTEMSRWRWGFVASDVSWTVIIGAYHCLKWALVYSQLIIYRQPCCYIKIFILSLLYQLQITFYILNIRILYKTNGRMSVMNWLMVFMLYDQIWYKRRIKVKGRIKSGVKSWQEINIKASKH